MCWGRAQATPAPYLDAFKVRVAEGDLCRHSRGWRVRQHVLEQVRALLTYPGNIFLQRLRRPLGEGLLRRAQAESNGTDQCHNHSVRACMLSKTGAFPAKRTRIRSTEQNRNAKTRRVESSATRKPAKRSPAHSFAAPKLPVLLLSPCSPGAWLRQARFSRWVFRAGGRF